jgi:hypothetical protein
VTGVQTCALPISLIMQINVPQPRFWIWVTLTFFIGILITILREKNV